jgi:hypothetical protein
MWGVRKSDVRQPICNFRDQWRVGETYDAGDLVIDASGVFLCLRVTTNELHDRSAWAVLFLNPKRAVNP